MLFIEKVKTFHKQHPVVSTLATVVAVGGLTAGSYFAYTFWNSPEAQLNREAAVYKNEYETMIAAAMKQTELPQNETPVLATVTNKDTLPKEQFFNKAQNGDKIIMYKKNKKVFLYRPSEKRILVGAKLDFQEDAADAFGADVAGAVDVKFQRASDSATPATGSAKTGDNVSMEDLFPQ
jgi:hypothetical protein